MQDDGKVDYVEFPAGDLPVLKAFYQTAFGWRFTDYGPTYASFEEGLGGGFDADPEAQVKLPLVVLYAEDLEALLARVVAAGGTVVKPIFSFPGGRRFHFKDPSGNELAAYSVD
jgi:predicted enzyme related to lactoylglutathione lyase